MAFTTEVSNLAVRIGTEFKAVYAKEGNLASLTTTDKASLVAAINELQAEILAGGSITADGISDATVTGKAVIRAVDQAAARTAIGAGTSNLAIGGGGSDAKAGNYVPTWSEITSKPTTFAPIVGTTAVDAKAGNYVPTWSEITSKPTTFAPIIGTTSTTAKAGDYQPSSANISDASTIGKSVLTAANAAAILTLLVAYSKSETDSAISTAIANLVNSSPAALDTLNELATALGNDPNFATTINTALGYRVRVDAAQTFTGPQKQQGRDNIDVYSKAEIGTVTTDYVAVFNAALV